MKLNFVVIFLIFLFASCKKINSSEKKIIDTGKFTIEVPANWNYKKEKGIDSFVGRIEGKKVELKL